MAAQVWDANLPPDWTCAVTSDGRIFFLNDATQESTWLHPLTHVTVQTGHRPSADLPQGWEKGVTSAGVAYYIDHNNQRTTLVHPITGRSEVQPDAFHSEAPLLAELDHQHRHDSSTSSSSFPIATTINGALQDFKKQTVKKSSSVGAWVKGRRLKRPSDTSIALQGWLSKQGSDGLQLWKRRWFLLSDYCLYYYKNPNEDKVLGYIPLPSFKIRPVCPEDRIFKRFAFKAEHENTRTYFFAADTKELMTKWMNALSLASILQKDTSLQASNNQVTGTGTGTGTENSTLRSDRPSVSSVTSSSSPTSPSADDSDSGFHGYRSKRFQPLESKSPVIFEDDPRTVNESHQQYDARSCDEASESSRLTGDRLNNSVDFTSQGPRRQPFYANAPPKPRRLNSSYEHSSTPDRSPAQERKELVPEQNPPPVLYTTNRLQGEPPTTNKRHQSNPSSTERRTPEAYGATSTLGRGDYEDVYGNAYDSPLHRPSKGKLLEPPHNRKEDQFLSEELDGNSFEREFPVKREDSLPRNWHQNVHELIRPPRPHSADFLEYDRRRKSPNLPLIMFSHRKAEGDLLLSPPPSEDQRSKSSVGGYHQDGDFWSEENYAAKMRESSFYRSYLDNNVRRNNDPYLNTSARATPVNVLDHSQGSKSSYNESEDHLLMEPRVPPAGAATPDLYVPQNVVMSQMSPNTSFGSSKRGVDNHRSMNNSFDDTLRNQSPNVVNVGSVQSQNSPTESIFLRSASARISRTKHLEDQLNTSFPDDGPGSEKKFQQREESMKRLLEWKQRMLQSPLTRKSCSRPESSASSTTSSSKMNNSGCNSFTPHPHYESESYRQQVLQELTSQELRGTQQQQLSNGSDDSTRRNSNNKFSSSPFQHNYPIDPNKKSQGERPAPQGGSEETSLDSIQNRKKDVRRETSRTRHLSEDRRSNSASSKYNSYSSDERDMIEDRNTRRKSRKSSRRMGELKSSYSSKSNKSRASPESVKAEALTLENGYDGLSHDYVNIDSLSECVNPLRENTVDVMSNNYNGSQRAVPVFIDDKGDWNGECNASNGSTNILAKRDPFYVTDVQITSPVEMRSKTGRESPLGYNEEVAISNCLLEPQYENKQELLKKEIVMNTIKTLATNDIPIYSNSIETTRILQYEPAYESSSCDSHLEHKSHHKFQDDNSIGKYSDSGYDTLKTDVPPKKDDKRNLRPHPVGNGCSKSAVIRRTPQMSNKRPETWSPDTFDLSWNDKSKVDEFTIIKEYSYEYITPEKNNGSNLQNMSAVMKLSSPDLPTLESPRIVQETQQHSNKNMVKDRIKCFSSVSQLDMACDQTDIHSSNLTDDIMKKPLTPIPPAEKSSEAYVSNLKEQFVSSSTTKIIAHEAQVKVLHDLNVSMHDGNSESSLEYRDLKSPQEIIDSRKNRSNIRKFVFSDGENNFCNKPDIKNKRSVKDLLKSFESKLEDVQDGYNYHKEESKRKFYSDSELLSNGSSSDVSDCEDLTERLPPPPASFLEELRTEAKKDEMMDLSPLIPPPRPPKKPHFGGEIDSRGRPRSLRLSLAESIEESLRMQSESENEDRSWFDCPHSKSYSNLMLNKEHLCESISNDNTVVIDMDKPPLEHAPPPPPLINSLARKLSIEENYLPMSPPKKPGQGGRSSVTLSSSNSSLSSSKHLPTPEPVFMDQFGKNATEDHTYIEMTGEPSPKPKYISKFSSDIHSLDLSKIGEESFSPESPRYYEIGEKDGQHYEYIYKTGPHYESIYMEVPPNSAETIKDEEKPKIPNKPHDLKYMKMFNKKSCSDSALISGMKLKTNGASEGSSDADDEASKDFDLIEFPKKPRFSLSDTFRPASYYLSGADLTTDMDAHDSSDSDLVPPPPIPGSPPPIDDMGTPSKSRKFSFGSKEGSVTSSNYASNDSLKPSTPQFIHKRSDSASSVLSNKMKRRPLPEDILDELNDDESFILKSEDIYPSSIGYPDDRNSYGSDKNLSWNHSPQFKGGSDMSLLQEDQHDLSFKPHSSTNSSFHSKHDVSYRHHSSMNSSFHSKHDASFMSNKQDDFGTKGNIYENSQIRQNTASSSVFDSYIMNHSNLPSMSKEFDNSVSDMRDFTKSPDITTHNSSMISCSSIIPVVQHGIERQPTISHLNSNFQQNTAQSIHHQRSSSELSMRSLSSPNTSQRINSATPIHIRGNSNLSNNSETSPRTAPYYYSDVIKDDNLLFLDESVSTPRARAYQLNNQRDLEHNKRQDIGRKVNQISTSTTVSMDVRPFTNNFENDLKHSIDLFHGKTIATPDQRNVYEADTLRKIKARTSTPDPDHDTKNLYPYGISIKSNDVPSLSGTPSHRRTRSLEGLVDDTTPRQRKPIPDLNEERLQEFESQTLNIHPPARNPAPERNSDDALSCNGAHSSSPALLSCSNRSISRLSRHSDAYATKNISPISISEHLSSITQSPIPNYPSIDNSIDNFDSTPPYHQIEGIVSREGSTSRLLNYNDSFIANESAEASNWEDDSQWREQLRRASLRHTRSLETLDEPHRPHSVNDYSTSKESKPHLKNDLVLHNESLKTTPTPTPKKCLDEYHVDYREGRIRPGSRNIGNLSEKTRKGLTSLEEYEWDTIEEKFRKPLEDSSRQSFLADGLPTSTGRDSIKSMDMSPFEEHPTIPPRSTSSAAREVEESHKEVGRPLSSSQEDPRHPQERNFLKSTPDIIPQQDVTRLGEVLHKKTADLTNNNKMASSKYGMQSESPLSNYSYGFGSSSYTNAYNNQTYQPHPHTNNPYHHYKSDDLSSKYSNPPLSASAYSHPYNRTESAYNPTYQNYRNQYGRPGTAVNQEYYIRGDEEIPYESAPKSNTYHDSPLDNNAIDYYNTGATYHDQGSSTYDRAFRETERLRQEEQMYQHHQQELAYQDYADRELAMSKSSLSAGSGGQDGLTSPRSFMAGVSAGELLGKTHEELVLLLIQLRRHQSALLAARKHTALERDSQTRYAQLESDKPDENLQRIFYLEEHLTELDKQFQMGKPLINLVDNMVKLGSLYRGFDRSNPQADPSLAQYPSPDPPSLEFSRQMLEKKILAEDRREYDSVTPDQIDLEGKVMELYKLEKKLQEESLTIQELQSEKEMLERTLENLHSRAQGTNDSIMELERRNRHRDYLERELSRMRSHLAVSARRLEETASENSRLEHEMMMLRQKIQSNMIRNAQRDKEGTSEARNIESEMLRVQSLLEDLQKRRMDLSHQIQRLTSAEGVVELEEHSPSRSGVSISSSYSSGRRRPSTWLETDLDRMTTRDRGLDMVEAKRRPGVRTPIDSLPYSSSIVYSRGTTLSEFAKSPDYSDDYPLPPPPSDSRMSSSMASESPFQSNSALTPVNLSQSKDSLVDEDIKSNSSYSLSLNRVRNESRTLDRNSADNKPDGEEQRLSPLNLDINNADEKMKRYYGIIPKEKLLEPKTVRIVKRESTERKKDRFSGPEQYKGLGADSNLSYVAEDEMESDDRSDIEHDPPITSTYASRTASLPRNFNKNANHRTTTTESSVASSSSSMTRPSNLPLRKGQNNKTKNENGDRPMSAHEQLFGIPRDLPASPPSSPSKSDPPSPVFKSAAAKEIIEEMTWEAEKHRRAVPKEKRRHFTISSSRPVSMESGATPSKEGARSRDDCDMARALRPRNHPDVVKSTLSTRDLRFNESTIDTLFGAPRKISIPERYIPDEDDTKEPTAEEKLRREEKARSIRKMLTNSTMTMTKPDTPDSSDEQRQSTNPNCKSSSSKLQAGKKERDHILAMNQILAKQVMEKSRMVAAHNAI